MPRMARPKSYEKKVYYGILKKIMGIKKGICCVRGSFLN
jgi:hypothetical protein